MIRRDQVEKALRLISNGGASYAYFFDQLKSPSWIAPLREQGLFSSPPTAQREGNYVSFPSWPASRYLVRMAAWADAQDAILDIITTVDTDNARVQQDFIDAALAMSPERAARLVVRASQWLREGSSRVLVREIGELIVHLAEGGQVADALSLLGVALSVPQPPSTASPPSDDGEELRITTAFLLDNFDYTSLLDRTVPALVEPAGQRLIRLLADTLDAVIRLDRGESDDDTKDQSLLWQPTLDETLEFEPNRIRASLFQHLRNSCVQVAALGPSDAREVVTTLRKHRYSIFSRLQLYLLGLHVDTLNDIAEGMLGDRELFELSSWRGEYAQLVEKMYPLLNENLQSTIRTWILAGPETETYVASRQYFSGQAPDSDEVARYVDRWKRNWLARIKDWLPTDARRIYDMLVSRLGPPDGLDEPAFKMTVGWGVSSPRSSEELLEFSTPDLVEFLQSWTPSGSPFDSRVEGLANELTRAVHDAPERFAQDAMRFSACRPEYIRALLCGLDQSVRADRSFPWEAVVKLCLVVAESTQASEPESSGADADGSEGRMTVIRLIDSALRSLKGQVPFELRPSIWQIIAALSEDVDPTPEYEETYGGTNMDPYTLSLNTVRGGALNAVVSYALWVRRQLSDSGNPPSSFDAMPEVRGVLDDHLDTTREPSLTVRSVYGRHAAALKYLDQSWFSKQIQSMFPTGAASRSLWESSWGAYLLYGMFRCPDFNALSVMYWESVRTLDNEWQVGWHSTSPNQRLAEHLMIHYVCGNVTLEGNSDLLGTFFDNATVELRQHALEFVGRWVRDDKGNLGPDDLAHLADLWEARYSAVASAAGIDAAIAGELVAFGWWFASGRFEDRWSLKQLQKVLVLAKRVDAGWLVVERLSKVADRFPSEAVACLRMLIDADAQERGMLAADDGVGEILRQALASGVPEATSEARSLIHHLGSLNRRQYRSLLDAWGC